jgi:hypothetical protein
LCHQITGEPGSILADDDAHPVPLDPVSRISAAAGAETCSFIAVQATAITPRQL